MENKKKLSNVRKKLVLAGLPCSLAQDAGIVLWILKGMWWVYAAALVISIPVVVWVIRYYYRNVAYICPECHEVFRPKKKDFIFSSHTMKTRKLTCVKCGHRGFCVETYGGNVK